MNHLNLNLRSLAALLHYLFGPTDLIGNCNVALDTMYTMSSIHVEGHTHYTLQAARTQHHPFSQCANELPSEPQ